MSTPEKREEDSGKIMLIAAILFTIGMLMNIIGSLLNSIH